MRDSLRRFLFENFAITGKLVHLDTAWQSILERADYPPAVRGPLGEAIAATALLASTIKFDGVLTFQMQGLGPLRLLLVQCTKELTFHGLARFDPGIGSGSLAELTGGGRLTVTVDQKSEAQRYQGIVPLSGDTVAECLQGYFEESEQLPTRLWLTATDAVAAGMLLQRVPDAHDLAVESAWPRVTTLADAITPQELINLSDRDLLTRLFCAEDIRLFDARPVAFRCRCSTRRVDRLLRALGAADVDEILEERGSVQVCCEFCNRSFEYDSVDVAALFAGKSPGSPPPRVH